MSVQPNYGEPPPRPSYNVPPPAQPAVIISHAAHSVPNFSVPPPLPVTQNFPPQSYYPIPSAIPPPPPPATHSPVIVSYPSSYTTVPPPTVNYQPNMYYPPAPNYSTPPPAPSTQPQTYSSVPNYYYPPPYNQPTTYAPPPSYIASHPPPAVPYYPRPPVEYRPRAVQSPAYRYAKPSRFSLNTSKFCPSTNEQQNKRSRSTTSSFRYKSANYSAERRELLINWRKNFCETSEDIRRKLEELSQDEKNEVWVRSSPADLFYSRKEGSEVIATTRLDSLCTLFEEELIKRSEKIRSEQTPYNPQPPKRKHRVCKHKSEKCSSSSSSSDDEFHFDEEDTCMEELSRKISHPYRLHPDLWHNETGEMNDGPLCRCSAKSRRSGIRHGIYPGEDGYPKCDLNSNNANKLYHYRITISPPTNFLTKTPTIIKHDQHEFIFEGFSLLSHSPIETLPVCKVIRFNIEYTILYIEEKMPENFTIRELDLFYNYLFYELLELIDFTLKPGNSSDDVCPMFHFLPRFVRDLPDNGKEILAMSEILRYLLDNSGSLVDTESLKEMLNINQAEWQDYVDFVKGMVVTNPGMKPNSVRIDQLDRNVSDLPECQDADENGSVVVHPVIVHFGIRPPQLSYAGDPDYQRAWKEYVKYRHLIANMSKPTYEDKRRLESKEIKLQEMRQQGRMKRNVTVAVSSKGFYRTGIMCDIVQHTMLIPVLTCHLRFHRSLDYLEDVIGYKFKNRYLLQLALTHPSYKENFGTNPDHARNSLTNCGIRQPEYGDRKIHYMNTRKRGINTLINIMSRFGKEFETDSNITHNERLEFLGDAVVEFLTSIHLFFMFPDLEEGGLATFRAAIVQNQHLAVLARKLHLEEYMLYAHGSDLCHELELRHAMANCFEALMGALLLDGGIEVADKVFAAALFLEDKNLRDTWENLPPHPLQDQEPITDRQWIESYDLLKNLTKFEQSIGVEFRHIRLLARAFTDRSIGFTHLTLGSNQRLEFLGDTVLQLICSEFLYRHFPEHHEGHLSLLRSSLVNNRTQAVVCDDLGMTQYAVYSNPKADLKTKDRADLLEAFLGALYVDQGLEHCETFCHVCLFPRLQDFIMNQDWNDPKSKLQQCCLTLRTMDGGEPDIPVYKVIECTGPTNTRVYTVAVYFRGKRLASSTGHSIQQAEMNAAKQALDNSQDLFPQLDHQKRVIAQSIKRQKNRIGEKADQILAEREDKYINTSQIVISEKQSEYSNLPKQYRPREADNSDDDDHYRYPSIKPQMLSDVSSCESLELSSPPRKSSKKKKRKKSKKHKKPSKRRSSSAGSTSSGHKAKSTSSPISNHEMLSPIVIQELNYSIVEDIISSDELPFNEDPESETDHNNQNDDVSDYHNGDDIDDDDDDEDDDEDDDDDDEDDESYKFYFNKTIPKIESIDICTKISDDSSISPVYEENQLPATFENSVKIFKVDGTEDLSSDLESGEIFD